MSVVSYPPEAGVSAACRGGSGRRWSLRIASVAAAVALMAAAAPGASAGPGRSANQLGAAHAAWWQWALSFKASTHPLNDTNCAAGQSDREWFLGGSVALSPQTRTCTIPSGTRLVVAVANIECSTLEVAPFGGTDKASLRACAAGVVDPASQILIQGQFATLDGSPLPVPRAPSPLFTFTVPSLTDNLLSCPAGVCASTTGQSVADGYLLVLHPLPVGHHMLHVGGSFPGFGVTLDFTFHITVSPHNHG